MLESLFNKGAGLVCNFIKKTLTQVFSCEICDIFKNTFFCRSVVINPTFRATVNLPIANIPNSGHTMNSGQNI